MEDGSSRMRPVGPARVAHGLPAGDPQYFTFTDRAPRGAAGCVRALFRRPDLR